MGILKKTITVLGLSATVFGLVLSGAPVANAIENVAAFGDNFSTVTLSCCFVKILIVIYH